MGRLRWLDGSREGLLGRRCVWQWLAFSRRRLLSEWLRLLCNNLMRFEGRFDDVWTVVVIVVSAVVVKSRRMVVPVVVWLTEEELRWLWLLPHRTAPDFLDAVRMAKCAVHGHSRDLVFKSRQKAHVEVSATGVGFTSVSRGIQASYI
ncbi:hypothetical protein H310_11810 [Aphanomyces invadans]|uniref:Uncharacterized protein n=1 Tax=Aphanomyces invadans TaxID=157072 RepID=A0A024TKH8_9STRA|nr:hypothetical protein H310_11810 [Aphanomyces invadans]ETV94494.1 hypothetical protein H310_11810 [Aphanomyces invadans]|eukprot:XP_008876809.1 hypothetical protein H310_11810 [Aphanomyces invadans]